MTADIVRLPVRAKPRDVAAEEFDRRADNMIEVVRVLNEAAIARVRRERMIVVQPSDPGDAA